MHATKAQLLTSLKPCKITVIMGKRDDEETSVLRIAASLAAWSKSRGQETESVNDDADESDLEKSHIEWDSTDKYRVLFVVKKTELQKLVGPESDSAEARRNMWRHGHLHFVLSAPRASYACWRGKWRQNWSSLRMASSPSRSLASCCHGWATPFSQMKH